MIVLGSTEPRLWTPPLRELTPETSYGYDLIDFARERCGTPFDEWQEWLSIHVGELLPDGRPRFRNVLVLVARQNGKSLWGHTLIKYWLFKQRVPLVLGTSTDRSYAKRAWSDICATAKDNEWMAAQLGPKAQRLTIGEEALTTLGGASYNFAANNGRAGRSTTLHRWLADELREHHTRDAWDSASKAMNAVPDAQIVAITNQGDHRSVVLDSLRTPALAYIESGQGDERLGLFEYSAPDGADPEDVTALAMANPNLGHRLDVDVLLSDAKRAKAAGGEELAGFRTEVMCQRVGQLDPAVDPDKWASCLDAGTMDDLRDRVAMVLDVSVDGKHVVAVAAAATGDGRQRVETVGAWSGTGAMAEAVTALPTLVGRVRPKVLGWFPDSPAAAIAVDLADPKKRSGRRGVWPPAGVKIAEIKADVPAVCMGFAQQVADGKVAHSDDPLLNAHVEASQKLWVVDKWRFTRRGLMPVAGAYAAAGAVHLSRTLPPPRPKLVAM